jgi:hypothetical protein
MKLVDVVPNSSTCTREWGKIPIDIKKHNNKERK